MDNTETINVLSLCTGYGGLELGLSGALEGVFRVVAVEVEAYALANLAAKAQEGKLAIEAMWPDLKTFPAERFRGCFDFILAGYPCQPFSVAGKRQGTDDPRHLWPHIARIVEAVRPVWCIFENVPGHLSIGYPEVYRSLRDMGYKVEAGLFTASEIGAPHKRQRLFIMAQSGYGRCEWSQGEIQSGRDATISSGQLADTDCTQGEFDRGHQGVGRLPQQVENMAHAGCTKLSGRQSQPGNNEQERQAVAGSCDKWPARPGQPQYEWEEPRVMADTARIHGTGRKRQTRGRGGICEASKVEYASEHNRRKAKGRIQTKTERESGPTGHTDSSGQGQTESRVGRAVNGPSCRVDRLRLLGNGVVPQQEEKAIRELLGRFE